ncbi:MAG TPA: hypothetical protein VFG59_09520 [Anaeromyxobacter sp.]|nr:hypothetical protein [Anaeromyxobacter sp.]
MFEGPSPTGALTAGRLLWRTLRVWARHAHAFTAVAIVVELPLAALELRAGSFDDPGREALFLIFAWFLGTLASGALSFGVLESLAGRRPRVGSMLGTAAARLWPIFAAAALYALTVLVGLFALLIPGVLALLAGYLAVPAVVAEPRLGPDAALRRSWSLTAGHRIVLLVVVAALLALDLLVGVAAEKLLPGFGLPQPVTVGITTVLDAAVNGLTGCCAAVAYHELRIRKDQSPAGGRFAA